MSRSVNVGSLLKGKTCRNPASNRRGDVPLQFDNVAHFVITLLRPHVRLAFNVDELRGYPNPIARPPETGLEQEVDAEFAADLVRALGAVFVLHRRRARDNAKSRWLEPAELRDHFFSEPVAKVLLVRIAGQVLERQHDQHDSRR